jgi:hydrogenase nickel incorporation protein HypA/HybF
MHELSLAIEIVEIAQAEARRHGNGRIQAVHLRLGPLAGVVEEALQAAFPLAAQGTVAEGAELVIEKAPLVVYCPRCGAERQIGFEVWLACPVCGAPTPEVRQGRELEVTALELET